MILLNPIIILYCVSTYEKEICLNMMLEQYLPFLTFWL